MEMIEEDRPRYRVSDGFKRDENSSREIIGVWTSIKLSIIRDYAVAYSRILSKQPYLRHVYIDAFAGAGEYQLKDSGSVVPGSLRIALDTDPPFSEYFFIDLDSVKVKRLLDLAQERGDINVYEGDCNQVLINDVLPRIEYKDYMRALCLLDPYNLSLEWDTVLEIAKKRTVDVFINLPMMDINMNALWKNPSRVTQVQAERLNRVWGDDSWRVDFYAPNPQLSLWGEVEEVKIADNWDVAKTYQERLRAVGFTHVPDPIPMRNSMNAIVYYLFFASYNETGARIAKHIFDSYRR